MTECWSSITIRTTYAFLRGKYWKYCSFRFNKPPTHDICWKYHGMKRDVNSNITNRFFYFHLLFLFHITYYIIETNTVKSNDSCRILLWTNLIIKINFIDYFSISIRETNFVRVLPIIKCISWIFDGKISRTIGIHAGLAVSPYARLHEWTNTRIEFSEINVNAETRLVNQ